MAAVTMCSGAFAAFATIAAMIVNPAAMAVEVPPCDAAIYLLRRIVTVHMPQLLMTQPELATLSFAAGLTIIAAIVATAANAPRHIVTAAISRVPLLLFHACPAFGCYIDAAGKPRPLLQAWHADNASQYAE